MFNFGISVSLLQFLRCLMNASSLCDAILLFGCVILAPTVHVLPVFSLLSYPAKSIVYISLSIIDLSDITTLGSQLARWDVAVPYRCFHRPMLTQYGMILGRTLGSCADLSKTSSTMRI
ncbi:hypothetical protein F5Y12DRAFT_585950 [Xylaria sp. FL1777]|nr:hypothetical protein F5Y12DRAFT_585950 [Xylaria sp. FL1777]